MKNVLILHGAGNNSQGNWFPWLKRELEGKGYVVWSPDLPNSDVPDLNDWLKTVFGNAWEFNANSIIVGHSSGATLILRILESLPKGTKVDKAILVASPVQLGAKPEYFQYKRSLVEPPFNWQKIKESCDKFYFIHSDNDPYQCGKDQGEILKEHLGGELIVKGGQGHFNLEKGQEYKQFPLLLDIIDR